MSISGNQLRAARALIGLDQTQLALAAAVGINTVRNMEAAGSANIRARTDTLDAIESFLKLAGVVFLPANGAGPGVRLRCAPQVNDDELLEDILLDADQIWIIRHEGVDQANTLRRAIQKTSDLVDGGHYINSIRSLGDKTIVEPDQIRRLLVRMGMWRGQR